ncbi:MAG: hypothetical protein JWQ29_379 [Phenylobacterium sp.]|nr:hypothetical protein [Phenylobacterium sp.]
MTEPQPSPSRRTLLALALAAPLAVAAPRALAADKVCIDPESLTDAEVSLRASVKFQERAADPAKPCSRCAFFKAEAEAPNCGQCQLLRGPVNATSSCASWAAK